MREFLLFQALEVWLEMGDTGNYKLCKGLGGNLNGP